MILSNALILVVSAAILIKIFLNRRRIKRKIFAYWYSRASKGFIILSRPYKIELFKTLKNLKSKDPNLAKLGVLRILEVGVGPCCNLEHYPDGSRLITVDPNENFMETFNENREKYPNVHLEKHYLGGGEDMSQIRDESVDIVVITYVLCSVDNHKKFLKEAHRVLVPGGRLYFLEHVAAKGILGKWAQTCIQPIWSQFTDDCQLTVPVIKLLEESPFRVETHRYFTLRELGLTIPCVWPQLLGVAVKD